MRCGEEDQRLHMLALNPNWPLNTKLLLYGTDKLNENEKISIFKAIQDYIISTQRFFFFNREQCIVSI